MNSVGNSTKISSSKQVTPGNNIKTYNNEDYAITNHVFNFLGNYRDNGTRSERRSKHGRLREPDFAASGVALDIDEFSNESGFANQRRIFGGSFIERGGERVFSEFETERRNQGWCLRR
jgi:hypothetical protein